MMSIVPSAIEVLVGSSSAMMVATPLTSQVLRRPTTEAASGEWTVQTGSSPGALVAVTPPSTGSKFAHLSAKGFSSQVSSQTCAYRFWTGVGKLHEHWYG